MTGTEVVEKSFNKSISASAGTEIPKGSKCMPIIGTNIVRLQELINTPMNNPPTWARRWQTEAEHLLHLSHNAKDRCDNEELQELDNEAKRLVSERETKWPKPTTHKSGLNST